MSPRDIVELTCREVVELATEYQCDALEAGDRVTYEQHLFGCTWCMTYIKQMGRTIELTKQLGEPAPAPVDTTNLAALFRGWKQGK